MSKGAPSAASVLYPYLTTQVGQLTSFAPQAMGGDPDAIHDMRVATRRLKSTLAVYSRCFEASTAHHLRVELDWLADSLGQARDPEVQRLVLLDIATDEETAAALEAAATVMTREAQRTLAEAVESERYQVLAKELISFSAEPAWASVAHRSAAKQVSKALRKQLNRLESRIDAAQTTSRPDLDERLHTVRKSLKRTRYALEASVPLYGAETKELARRLSLAQDALGDHNDLVATRSSAGRWSELTGGGLSASVWEALDKRVHESRSEAAQQLIELRDVTLQAAPPS